MKVVTSSAVKNKRVLMRVDFNVAFDKQGNIVDDFRIIKVLPTIKFLKDNNSEKIILISHLGRPQSDNKEQFSLKPVAKYLEQLLGQKIYFLTTDIGPELKKEIDVLPDRSIVFLENIRFYPEEEENSHSFAQELSQLGNVFINEAFSVSHRKAASISAITEFLPSYIGLLFQAETKALDNIKNIVSDRLVIILGGAKIKDKLPIINYFLDKAKFILVGGAIANTIIKSWDFEVGNSLVEPEMIAEAKNLGSQKAELVIPGDYEVLTDKNQVIIRNLGEITKTDTILDIGPGATKTFEKIINEAEIIFWSGPLGKIEDNRFRKGTKGVIDAILSNDKAQTVIGGGDTLMSIKLLKPKYSLENTPSRFFSTGGGAMLEYLAN